MLEHQGAGGGGWACREKRDISTREMKKVVELLKQAAGVTIDERAVSRGASGRADGRSEVDTDETWTWEDVGSPGITYENYTHAGALFELAYMFEIGAAHAMVPRGYVF